MCGGRPEWDAKMEVDGAVSSNSSVGSCHIKLAASPCRSCQYHMGRGFPGGCEAQGMWPTTIRGRFVYDMGRLRIYCFVRDVTQGFNFKLVELVWGILAGFRVMRFGCGVHVWACGEGHKLSGFRLVYAKFITLLRNNRNRASARSVFLTGIAHMRWHCHSSACCVFGI